jgi:hypothetical protein
MQRAIERTGVVYKDSRHGLWSGTFQDSVSPDARIAAELAAQEIVGLQNHLPDDGEVVRVQLVEIDDPVNDWAKECDRLRMRNLALEHLAREAISVVRRISAANTTGSDHPGGLLTAEFLTDAALALSH